MMPQWLKQKRALWTIAGLLSALFLYLDPTATWVETGRPFAIAEGLPATFEPLPNILLPWQMKIAFSAYVLLTAIFGYLLVAPLWFRTRSSLLMQVLASFIPGYIGVCAVNRLATLALPHKYAPTAIWLILIFSSANLFVIQRSSISRADYSPEVTPRWVERAIFFGLFSLCLIEGIQWGYHYLNGDGTWFFLNYLGEKLPALDLNQHFPLVDQHSDEVIFNYPLLYGFNKTPSSMVLFWLLNAVGRCSLVAFMYLTFRRYRMPKNYSFVATAFFFFGTNAINPTKYLLSFDAANPLFYTLHIGRTIGAILPIFWFAMLETTYINIQRRVRLVALPLFAIGITTMTVHNALTLVFTTVFWLLIRTIPIHAEQERSTNRTSFVLLSIAAAPIITYSLTTTSLQGLHGILLLAAVVAGGLGFLLQFESAQPGRRLISVFQRSEARIVVVLLATLAAAAVTIGNVGTVAFRRVLQATGIWNFSDSEPPLSRGLVNMETPTRFMHFVGCEGPTSHCKSGLAYLGYYGMPTMMALLAFYFCRRAIGTKMRAPVQLLIIQLLFVLTAFCASLLVKDFFDKGTMASGWLLTRLIETPYYVLVFIFFLVVGRLASTNFRRRLMMVLSIWIILPILFTHRLDQWWLNVKFLINSGFFR